MKRLRRAAMAWALLALAVLGVSVLASLLDSLGDRVLAQGTTYLTQTFRVGAGTPYSLTWPADDGTAGQFLLGNGSGTISWTSGCRVLESDTTQNATDDGTPETLWSYAIPANTFDSAGDRVRITAFGTLADDADAKQVDLDFGATELWTFTDAAGGVQYDQWQFSADVAWRSAAVEEAFSVYRLGNAGAAAAFDVLATSPTEDETATITVAVVADGTNASDVVFEVGVVEFCEAP